MFSQGFKRVHVVRFPQRLAFAMMEDITGGFEKNIAILLMCLFVDFEFALPCDMKCVCNHTLCAQGGPFRCCGECGHESRGTSAPPA